MRFTLLALPVFAVAVKAAAITTTTTAAGPATYTNTKAAIASVIAELAKKAPKTVVTTKTTTTATKKTTVATIATTKSTAPTKSAASAVKNSVVSKASPAPIVKVVQQKKHAVAKRQSGACSVQPKTFDYTPSDKYASSTEILTNYLSDAVLTASSKASGTPPKDFNWVWQSFYASAENKNYLGWMPMTSYNVADCADACTSMPNCRSFNIFFERAPSLFPATACPNPPAITNIKCTFFSVALTAKMATNTGQWRERFAVAITGSNAYTKA